MTPLLDRLPVDLLGATLLHFLWQGCLIALALLMALRLCASAERRYLAGLVALALMLAAPFATAAWLAADEPSVSSHRPPTLSGISSGAVAPLPAFADDPAGVMFPSRRESIVVGLWLLGVLALSALHTGGWIRLQLQRRAASPLPRLDRNVAELCRRMGLRSPVPLRESAAIDVPMVIGCLKPVVLLPASALTGMSVSALEALILHELAHIRRHDYLVNLLQSAVETLLFYHPAVWWVSRTIRVEREHLCDDLAAGLCARRVDYMEALAELERRRLTPTLAIAANGGSLMGRIRRLTGQTAPATVTGWSLALGLLTLTLALALAPTTAPPLTAQTSDSLEGEWRAESDGERIHLELRQGSRYRSGRSMDRDDLQRTASGYALVRDAGTFELFGDLDEGWSRFVFRGDPGYVSEMARLGFEVDGSSRGLMEMASLDVSLQFARGIAAAGYDDIPSSRLVEFRIHGVTREFITGLTAAGLDDLSAGRLVEFRIHGVTPEFVQAMTDSGFGDTSPGRLVEFRIHGVTPEFVAGMAGSGLEDLSASRLVEFRIHGVTPEFVRAMVDSGLGELTASRLVEFRIHGVSPQFVVEMNDLVGELTPGRLVEFRIHNVTPDFVRRAQERHGGTLSASELVSMRIHGRGL